MSAGAVFAAGHGHISDDSVYAECVLENSQEKEYYQESIKPAGDHESIRMKIIQINSNDSQYYN